MVSRKVVLVTQGTLTNDDFSELGAFRTLGSPEERARYHPWW